MNRMRESLERHLPMVYRTAWALTGNEVDAQDLAHDAMVAALSSLRRFRGESKLSTWLTAILLNRHRSWRRARAVRARTVPAPEPVRRDPGAEAAGAEDADLVRAALLRLDEDDRLLIALAVYQGLDSSEIGRLTGRLPGTVRSRLHEVRSRLRESLSERSPHE